LQEFCYHLFENAIENTVDERVFDAIYDTILHDIALKIWQQKIQHLSDVSLKIFYLISSGHNTTQKIIIRADSLFDLREGTVKSSLSRMLNRRQIQKLGRGEYAVSDKLFGEYVRQLF